MTPIGLAIAGPVADHYSIQIWFIFGGGVCVLMGIAGLMIPSVMNVENLRSQGVETP